MSLLKPLTTRNNSSTIPTELKRHIAVSETRRPRTFSASAHSTWPPSSGRNGNRFIDGQHERDEAEEHERVAGPGATASWAITVIPTMLWNWWRTFALVNALAEVGDRLVVDAPHLVERRAGGRERAEVTWRRSRNRSPTSIRPTDLL